MIAVRLVVIAILIIVIAVLIVVIAVLLVAIAILIVVVAVLLVVIAVLVVVVAVLIVENVAQKGVRLFELNSNSAHFPSFILFLEAYLFCQKARSGHSVWGEDGSPPTGVMNSSWWSRYGGQWSCRS